MSEPVLASQPSHKPTFKRARNKRFVAVGLIAVSRHGECVVAPMASDGIFFSDEIWITQRRKDSRLASSQVQGTMHRSGRSTLALGHASGKVTFFHFISADYSVQYISGVSVNEKPVRNTGLPGVLLPGLAACVVFLNWPLQVSRAGPRPHSRYSAHTHTHMPISATQRRAGASVVLSPAPPVRGWSPKFSSYSPPHRSCITIITIFFPNPR